MDSGEETVARLNKRSWQPVLVFCPPALWPQNDTCGCFWIFSDHVKLYLKACIGPMSVKNSKVIFAQDENTSSEQLRRWSAWLEGLDRVQLILVKPNGRTAPEKPVAIGPGLSPEREAGSAGSAFVCSVCSVRVVDMRAAHVCCDSMLNVCDHVIFGTQRSLWVGMTCF